MGTGDNNENELLMGNMMGGECQNRPCGVLPKAIKMSF